MKTIRLIIIFITFFQGSTNIAQEISSIENQNGFKISKESGIIAQLTSWKKFGSPDAKKLFKNPQERQLLQSKIPQTMKVFTNDYEFYGGEYTTGNNVPFAMASDAQGNTYITGGSSNENWPAGDFFTMKVSPLGTILWQARIPAEKYAVEYGMKLLLDNEGNVVVTGLQWNGNDMDIRTIKYSPDGATLWMSNYNSPNLGIDVPSAMVVGTDGSIYITGISWSGPSVDYITLKYTANGNLEWQARDNGLGANSWNEATAIAIDNANNVIVTGFSPNNDGWLNYHTVKYSANGTELWAQDYNYASTDPENPSEVTNSVPRSIVTDANNNIYVTGIFDTFLGRIGTIKYNATGEQQWIRTYKTQGEETQGWQIALRDNKLYVAGSHNGNFANNGNILLSYELDGTQNWVRETTDLIDAINVKLLFDMQGNPVVAAKGMTPGAEEWTQNLATRAKKYSPQGNLLGQAAFVIETGAGTASMGDMAGIGLDTNNNIYFSINSFYSEQGAVFETIKSTFGATAPDPVWNTVYTNTAAPNASMLYSFADTNGNTFSTGYYYNFEEGTLNANYFLVKYNPQGNIDWQTIYNAENGNAADGIIARADSNGNTFVYLLPQFGGTLITLKKISPAGQELWETQINLNRAQINVMETGADGSVYLGGTAHENISDENPSFVGVRISATGQELWKTFITSPNITDTVYTIKGGKVTPSGDFIVTGNCGSGNFISQAVNLTVLKFNGNGTPAWQTPVAIGGNSSSGTDIIIGNDGAIYTNGFIQNNDTFLEDILTAKLSADGTLQWSQVFGAQDRNERSYTLKQFSDGAIAVIGYTINSNDEINNVLIKYDGDGEELWYFESESMRYYNGFHIDGADKCYIMDQVIIDPFPHKIYTPPFPIASLITVDASGNGEEEFFVGPEYAEFYGKNLIPHTDNRLLLAGNIANQFFYQGLHFFETEHIPLSVNENEIITSKNKLGQNYPNPVKNTTTIPFYLVNGGKASIKLYSSDGKLIEEIANDTFIAGNSTLVFDTGKLTPGTYFYQITAGKFKQARKMVISR